MKLSKKEKIHLKGLAHELQPIVYVGKNGITEAFKKALDQALIDHELIKIKFQAFKEERKEMTVMIAEAASAELIGEVGNIAILYRQNSNPEKRKISIPQNILE